MSPKKQLFFLYILLSSSIFIIYPCPLLSKVINILSPLNYLDFQRVQEIKNIGKFDVNIEFVSSKTDYLYKIKNGYGKYDVVIANSEVIKRLHDNYEMLSLDFLKKMDKEKENKDGYPYFKELSIVPYGLITKENLNKENTSWNVLTDRTLYPKFRQQIFLPKRKGYYDLAIASFANNKELSINDSKLDSDVKKWLFKLKGQLILSNDSVLKLLEKNKMLLTADFLTNFQVLKKEIKPLKFIIPKEGTFYNDISIAILASSKRQNEAVTFTELLFKSVSSLNDNLGYFPNSKIKSIPRNWKSISTLKNLPKKLERQVNRIMNY